ncbi:MAG: hypothetical protein Q9219_001116 [cf. Caloplaca sp. 3 TL-2023]
MAAVTITPGLSALRTESDSETPSTLPDTQSPLTSPEPSRSSSVSSQHPDLSNEVATLSNKLIRAINHQTDLDDTLAETRHELDEAQQRVKHLESVAAKHNDLITRGELLSRDVVKREKIELMENLAHEQQQRDIMEKDKRGMEQELESLTTALFEEANHVLYTKSSNRGLDDGANCVQMVAAARKECEAADRRSGQLRAQLNETELLLVSHQEQLAQLKVVMHQMSIDREGSDANTTASTAPSTPTLQTQETLYQVNGASNLSPASDDIRTAVPAPPTSFIHLLQPVLRTDLQAYDDFRNLLSLSRNPRSASRASSGSFSDLNVTSLSRLANSDRQHPASRFPSAGSASSLSTVATSSSSSITPSFTNSSLSSRDAVPGSPALKETRFYKRVLAEDIEPTLRLDTAPGLSWLARRTVINSMSEGSLVVEPMPAASKHNVVACSLCGENRKGEEYARAHRFRTSEYDGAQRYPLCTFCLARVRASCDFLGFLRILKDGHWKADDEETESQAWEESVRLRERMFWARIGGGVVPTVFRAPQTLRESGEQDRITPVKVNENLTVVDGATSTIANDIGRIMPTNSIGACNDTSHVGCGIGSPNKARQAPAQPVGCSATTRQSQEDVRGVQLEGLRGLGFDEFPPMIQEYRVKNSTTVPGAFE